jgi:hypothetical protein
MVSPSRLLRASLCGTLFAGCVFDCGDDPATQVLKRSASPPGTPGAAEAAAEPPLPQPTGPTTPWQSFSPFAPDSLGEFTATAAPEGKNLPVPGTGEITALKRHYEKNGTRVDVEIIDALYAPAVRQIIKKMKDSDRGTGTNVLKGTTVLGHPAIVQWADKTEAGRVGVLLGDRYIVNLALSPAPDAEAAKGLVALLALDAIAKVAPPAPGTTPPPGAAAVRNTPAAPSTGAPNRPFVADPGATMEPSAPEPIPGEQVAPSRPAQ